MMKPKSVTQNSALLHLAFVVVSGVIWVSVWLLNKHVFSAAHVVTGISLIFVPAGFRLLIILVFGVWGSLGIFLFEPFLFFNEFSTGSLLDVFTSAAISAFSPLLATALFCRAVGIRESLTELKPWHLPILALVLALFTPLLFNILFVVSGKHPLDEFARNYAAMATGDFLGCLLVIGGIKAGFWVLREFRRAS